MDIKDRTLRLLGLITTHPDKYKDILDLPDHVKKAPEADFMSYMGMILQGILVVNDSSYYLTTHNYEDYVNCMSYIKQYEIAYTRTMPASIRTQFMTYLNLKLPIDWIIPFIKEYQLKLYGDFLYVDAAQKEYLSDFNDERLFEKAEALWNIQYKPLLRYDNRENILAVLKDRKEKNTI